jgi:long-subunit fatty acid transport protein
MLGQHMRASKRLLLASVSGAALALSVPAAMAADLAPARERDVPHTWTFWLEGGAQAAAGSDAVVTGFNPAFATPNNRWGWNGALGFDYRVDQYWHASGAFRYGQNTTHSTNSGQLAQVGIPGIATFAPAAVAEPNVATRNETNWEADFMVGRDIGLGTNNPQLKVGLRVADIRGRTEGTAAYPVTVASSFTLGVGRQTRAYEQTNHFLGAGPRLALEGSAPVGGGWFVDYMGGVAGLYAIDRSAEQTVVTNTIAPPGQVAIGSCVAGCPINATSETNGFVFNADAMLGLGYAITSYARLSVNYRVDAYFNAMRTFDLAGNAVNVNRVYHGPNIRLTLTY